MPPYERRESISQIIPTIKGLFRTPQRQQRSVAVQEAESISPAPQSGLELGLLTPGPTPSTSKRRRISTSAPSSPTTTRPQSKLQKITSRLFTRSFASSARIPSPSAEISPLSLIPRHTETGLDAIADYDPGSLAGALQRDPVQSTGSLASDRSSARAPARASSSSDEKNANLVLKTIKDIRSETYRVEKGGQGGKYLVERKLPWAAYNLLLKKLEQEDENLIEKDKGTLKGYVNTRLRFDYTPRPRKGEKHFTVHMPCHMHEGMAGALNETIIDWYREIRKGRLCKDSGTLEATKMIAREIRSILATRVDIDNQTRQEPDLSFTFRRGRIAGLLVEVAWSQNTLKLPERADRYITGSNGNVRTVIGISLNDIYNGGKRAWFSKWQARFDEKNQKWTRVTTVDHQMFIDQDGKSIEDCALRVSLKDFICEEDAREEEEFEDVPLEITSKELHSFYEDSLQPHVCSEIEDEKTLISKDVKDDLEKIIEVEGILQESKVTASGEQKDSELEDLRRARGLLTDIHNHIKKRRHNLEVLRKNLERVGDDKSRDVRYAKEVLVEAESELSGLERKIQGKTSEVERKVATESKKAAVEQRTRRASRINAAEPSAAQSSGGTSFSLGRAVEKSKASLSWSRKTVGSS